MGKMLLANVATRTENDIDGSQNEGHGDYNVSIKENLAKAIVFARLLSTTHVMLNEVKHLQHKDETLRSQQMLNQSDISKAILPHRPLRVRRAHFRGPRKGGRSGRGLR